MPDFDRVDQTQTGLSAWLDASYWTGQLAARLTPGRCVADTSEAVPVTEVPTTYTHAEVADLARRLAGMRPAERDAWVAAEISGSGQEALADLLRQLAVCSPETLALLRPGLGRALEATGDGEAGSAADPIRARSHAFVDELMCLRGPGSEAVKRMAALLAPGRRFDLLAAAADPDVGAVVGGYRRHPARLVAGWQQLAAHDPARLDRQLGIAAQAFLGPPLLDADRYVIRKVADLTGPGADAVKARFATLLNERLGRWDCRCPGHAIAGGGRVATVDYLGELVRLLEQPETVSYLVYEDRRTLQSALARVASWEDRDPRNVVGSPSRRIVAAAAGQFATEAALAVAAGRPEQECRQAFERLGYLVGEAEEAFRSANPGAPPLAKEVLGALAGAIGKTFGGPVGDRAAKILVEYHAKARDASTFADAFLDLALVAYDEARDPRGELRSLTHPGHRDYMAERLSFAREVHGSYLFGARKGAPR